MPSLTLCHIDDIPPDAAKGFSAGGISLVAVRRGADVHVYRNSCPHLGVELNWIPDLFLDRSGQLIQCSTHGALFAIDSGYCIAGPCRGRSLQGFPTELANGEIIVTLPDTSP